MGHNFTFVNYLIDSEGNIWAGPYCPDSNLHWGKLNENGRVDVLSRTEPPEIAVEITPRQAALYLQLRKEGINA